MSKIAGKLPSKVEFASAVDSHFRMCVGEGRDLDIVLAEFDEHVANAQQENFSLLFRAPVDAPPAQSIYRLSHDTMGEMDLFLVPVRRDAEGLYYEAVFNKFLTPAAA